jgi:succinate dehydrogenase flavin-adding protein (antitoxin of CptAB toxin-antitoxin module)
MARIGANASHPENLRLKWYSSRRGLYERNESFDTVVQEYCLNLDTDDIVNFEGLFKNPAFDVDHVGRLTAFR